MWASVGSRGTATSKTAGADLTFSPTATVQAGNVLVIACGWPQDFLGTGAGSISAHDSKGNLYTTIAFLTWESVVFIFICRVTSPILTSDTITLHHKNNFHEAKSATAWEFSMEPSKRWARHHVPGAGCSNCIGSTLNMPGLSQEALILGAVSSVGPSTDIYTFDPDYTAFDIAGTTGGDDSSNITVCAQFRIANVPSGDIITLTRNVNRHTDSVGCALYETVYVSDFPRFPILDDFNRANEDPLDNGNWEPFDPPVFCTPNFGGGELRIDSNQVRKSALNPGGAGGQWWLDPFEGCYAESYVSVPVKGQAGVHLDGGGCGHNATMGGYAGYWFPRDGGVADDYFAQGFSGGTGFVAFSNALKTWVDLENNHRFGLQRDSRDGRHFIHGWINRGLGWEWVSAWHDSAFGPFEGRVGISVWGDTLTRLDDFGAGASQCPGDFIVNMNWRSADRQSSARRILTSASGN